MTFLNIKNMIEIKSNILYADLKKYHYFKSLISNE